MENDKNAVVLEILPVSYDYKIVNAEFFDDMNNGISIVVRININSKESVLQWLQEFQQKNQVTLRVLRTCEENTQKISFKKEYRCSHNTLPRKGSTSHPKHTSCTAKVTTTLKNQNMKRSKDIYLKTHPCEIYIRHTHNHALYSSTVLKYLPPAKELENTFRQLFEKGHSPSSALKIFKDNCLEEFREKYHEVVADGQKYPTQKWVYNLYYIIFKKEYGEPTGIEMISSLEKNVKEYNKRCKDTCAAIYRDEDNLAVAVCSPLMKRVHENIKSSSEIMFVDSSGNMDRHNTRIFLFLCPSCVGALPLGILFLYSESEKSIINGINLLKTILPKKSFYNCGYSKVIITNDSTSERNALQKCFPKAKLLLCKFHVLQATMRYLWDSKNGVNINDRTYIYTLFNKALNCLNIEVFVKQYDYLLNLKCVSGNKTIFQYLNNLKCSASIWAMCYRQNEITRGNETNNYCEAMSFKDTILQQTKAFSIVQLFDYMTTCFEQHYSKNVIDIINGRWEGSKKKNKYCIDEKQIIDLECTELGCNLYKVQSKENIKECNIVNYELECCSCYIGKRGASCKHQFAVIKKFNLPSEQFHPTLVDSHLKQLLHYVITGDECKVSGWYENITEINTTIHILPTEHPRNNNSENQLCTNETADFDNVNKIRSQLEDIFTQLMHKFKDDPETYQNPISAFIRNFNSCKTESSLISALHTFGKYSGAAVPLIKRGKNTQGGRSIGVQPTAQSRRTTKLAGQGALQSARPAKRQRLSDHCYSKANNDTKV